MTMEPLDVVKQTGKTIIFEEFNKEKMDLVTLLTRDEQEISVEKFKNALMGKKDNGGNGELVVTSFEEFVEKFAPTIYETVVKTEDNTSKFVYELEKPKYECTQIRLKDHAFYKMVMSMIDRKAATDKGNLDFSYDDLKKALTPQSEMEECKRIRKNYLSNVQEYYRLTEGGVPNPEADRFAENIEACRDKIIDKYQNKSPLALLPLLIADKQSQIDKMDMANEAAGEDGHRAVPCSYSLDERGNLVLIEQSISDDACTDVPLIEENTQLVEVLRDDFTECAPAAIRENTYVRDLVVNVFAPGGGAQLTTQDKAELEAVKKQYQDVYRSSLESFAKAVSEVVEKFAGMKAFFDHASCDGALAEDVSVIIANCKIDAILNDEGAKRRFKHYFGALSAEKDVNKIWFGVIPAVVCGNDVGERSTRKVGIDPFARRSPRETVKKKPTEGLIRLETVKEMLKLLEEVKIMTFTNYKASEKTGFVALTASKVNEYRKDFESVNSEYGVFCYPNFTILPSEKTAVKIGTEYDVYRQEVTGAYIVIPGIYLDASYVAAGMMVGMQNYKLLKSKGYLVKPKYPCVRFDIENGDNAKRILTKMNRETTTEMEKQTKDAIMEERFGFVFADNKIIYEGAVIHNTYVLNARTLKRDSNGKYKSLYKTLVRSLVDQILRSISDYVTEESVKKFIAEYANAWKRDNKDAERKYANRILFEGESIDLDQERHKLVVRFNKDEEVWDDIVINDTESEE